MPKPLKFTPLQAKFIHEYCFDQNGTRAAIRAGYAQSGAHVEASKLLRIPKVRDAIQREMNKHLDSRGVKVRTVLNRLDDLAGFDPNELINEEDGRLLKMSDIPLEVRRCIKEITIRDEWDGSGPDKTKVAEIIKVSFHDRIKANELLGKHLKMFNEEKTVKHEHSLEALVAGSDSETRDVTPAMIEAAMEEGDEE